jgi:hypothetical protein
LRHQRQENFEFYFLNPSISMAPVTCFLHSK